MGFSPNSAKDSFPTIVFFFFFFFFFFFILFFYFLFFIYFYFLALGQRTPLQSDTAMSNPAGPLTTHILDTTLGRPAANVPLRLERATAASVAAAAESGNVGSETWEQLASG